MKWLGSRKREIEKYLKKWAPQDMRGLGAIRKGLAEAEGWQ